MKRIAGFLIGFVGWFVLAHLFVAFVDLRWWWFTEWDRASRGFSLLVALYCGVAGAFFPDNILWKVKAR